MDREASWTGESSDSDEDEIDHAYSYRLVDWEEWKRRGGRLSFSNLSDMDKDQIDCDVEGEEQQDLANLGGSRHTHIPNNWHHFEGYRRDCVSDDPLLTTWSTNNNGQLDSEEVSYASSQFPWSDSQRPACSSFRQATGTLDTSRLAAIASERSIDDLDIAPPFPKAPLVPPRRAVSLDPQANENLHEHQPLSPTQQRREARKRYYSRIMPNKVILIRHGQSMGNTDEKLYSTTPDNAMPLTERGWQQARAAGRHLKSLLQQQGDNKTSVHFIVSPYVRTVETFHGLAAAWCDTKLVSHIADPTERRLAWYSMLRKEGLTWREDPRIREQDFGNYQQPEAIKMYKNERAQFGAFYYRFPHGESGSDVFDRISTFLDSLWRSFDVNNSRHYVLVTHGIAIRVLLTRYFRYTVDQFHLLANPCNCEMVVLGHDNRGNLSLEGRHELQEEADSNKTRIIGYKRHERLRVLPDEFIRRVNIRLSFDE